tara:strand:+ start:2387 stop:2668 length:282 start_codon:yes stop_codon:yes gene_type:complete
MAISLINGGYMIVNLKNNKNCIKIDRSTIFGNPFRIGIDGNREEVIKKYEEWIMKDEQLILRNKMKKELKNKILGCWCKPLPCHGDIIMKIIK